MILPSDRELDSENINLGIVSFLLFPAQVKNVAEPTLVPEAKDAFL